MKTDEIIEMARRAGFDPHDMSSDFTCNLKDINSFAKLVAQHEREACVQIVENEAYQYASPVWAFEIVNDIKSRGQA